jgi:hypothetical protein
MLRLFTALGLLILTAGGASAQYAGITPCASKSLAVTSSSGNVLLSSCGQTVILYNISSQEAYYNWGSASNTAATTSGNYIPGGGFVVLNLPAATYLAGITPTSTTTFKVVQGAAKP